MIGPLLFTPGEPAGIGPDLCIALAARPRKERILVISNPDLLQQRAALLGQTVQLVDYKPDAKGEYAQGRLEILPLPLAGQVTPGRLNPNHAKFVLRSLDTALDLCLNGQASALITGPVHKGNINAAGIPFSGHTEYLAERSGGRPVMMLATPGLRVALATTHLPLTQVPAAITPELLRSVLAVLWHELRTRFGLEQPRILVAGLNPHAGEGGYLGREEIEIIEPVLAQLREQGMNLTGPLPADTLFTPRWLKQADAVLAMYHDQGLPVLKHLGFGKAVNITLGLPFVRTSVDHGTALDLAGSGQADPGSLLYAIAVAAQMRS